MRVSTTQTLAPLAIAGSMASQLQIPESGGELVLHSEHNGGESATITTPTTTWPGPGIFVKVDFGVAFTPTSMRRLSINYASRNLGDQMVGGRNGIRRVKGPGAMGPLNSNPIALTPGETSRRADGERERPGRRKIRSRSATQMRTSRSPVSPLSPPIMYHGTHAFPAGRHPHHSYSSGSTTTSNIDSLIANNPNAVTSPIDLHYSAHSTYSAGPSGPVTSLMDRPHPLRIRQSTIDRKPLPPLPSRFRLGEDDLPWSSPMSFMPIESPFVQSSTLAFAGPASSPASPTSIPPNDSSRSGNQNRNGSTSGSGNIRSPREDPERTRELATLQTAMMTVDSLGAEDYLSSPTSARRGYDGPGGVGWAVRLEDQMEAWEEERLRGRERRERGGGSRTWEPAEGIALRGSRTWDSADSAGLRGSRVLTVGDDFVGWYGEEVSWQQQQQQQSHPISPPPEYEGRRNVVTTARGTWGWEWEWEDREGYWVRADLRRSYSR